MFDVIHEMFDRAFKRVNTFKDFRTELVEGKEKRAGEELMQENAKKQRVEDDKETAKLKQCLEIIPDEEEVTMNVIPLAVKSPKVPYDNRIKFLAPLFSLCYLFRNPFSSTTMGDENPIRTLGDYSKPSHEGYMNTIELPVGNNVVPLRSDTIRLVQNGCSFHRLRSEDPNQHLKDFLKLVDSLDLDGENMERTRLQDLALYDNESWNDPRDFAKLVKAIALPQDVPSTSDRRLIELENQVQRLMEAHLAPTQPTQVNKVTTSCEICSGPHDTRYCMKDPEQAFVEYASSRNNDMGKRKFTADQEPRNFNEATNTWKDKPNFN
ncbi:hypothetical protein Tco_1020470 [Tanacetum coccineum]